MKFDTSNKYKAISAVEYLNSLISKLKHVEIRELKMKRSLDANSLYWVWLTCIEVENGINKNDAHLLYRAMYLRRDEDYIIKIIRPELWLNLRILIDQFHYFKGLDQIIDVIAESTTEQDSPKFNEYLNKIKVHAKNNMGIVLLNLDEENFREFYREYGFR